MVHLGSETKDNPPFQLEKKKVAVNVRFVAPNRLELTKVGTNTTTPWIRTLPAGTRVRDLPEGFEVTHPEGRVIPPKGRYVITSDSIDPFHAIVDLV